MLTLVFDTETSGLPDFKAPHYAEQQPDVIQFGMQVYDERYPVFELGCLVDYNRGIIIEPDAARVHGISVDMCKRHGWNEGYFANEIDSWFSDVDRIVAHNASFDLKMMRTFWHRRLGVEKVYSAKVICTMHSSTRICQLPGTRGFKWPKLSEAYERLVDPRGFGDAHNALADVGACAKILWALEDAGHPLYNEKNQPLL